MSCLAVIRPYLGARTPGRRSRGSYPAGFASLHPPGRGGPCRRPDKKVTLSFLLKRFVAGMDLDGLARHQSWISNIAPPLLQRLTGESIESASRQKMRTAACNLISCNNGILENTLAEGLLTKADRSSMEVPRWNCARHFGRGGDGVLPIAAPERSRATIGNESFLEGLRLAPVFCRKASCIGASAGLCRCRSQPGYAGRCARGPETNLASGQLEQVGIRTIATPQDFAGRTSLRPGQSCSARIVAGR